MTEVSRLTGPTDTPQIYETTYRPSDDGSIVLAITEAVADVTGVDAIDLDERLYDRVDPEALAQLVDEAENGRSPTRVSFEFCDYTVAVDSDGHVAVYPDEPSIGR